MAMHTYLHEFVYDCAHQHLCNGLHKCLCAFEYLHDFLLKLILMCMVHMALRHRCLICDEITKVCVYVTDCLTVRENFRRLGRRAKVLHSRQPLTFNTRLPCLCGTLIGMHELRSPAAASRDSQTKKRGWQGRRFRPNIP